MVSEIICIFAGAMRQTTCLRLLSVLFAALLCTVYASAARGPKVKYPGGKYYIWRYTLKDKEGSPYSIEHPSRWLSHKSIERRRRQGLPIDSTDLPVSPQYLKAFENTSSEQSEKTGKSPPNGSLLAPADGTTPCLYAQTTLRF